MSLIPITTILLGSFSGIAVYKQHPVDYKMLGIYFSIITPYQAYSVYSNLDIISKLKLQCVKPYIHIPIAFTMLSLINGSIFGLGYVVAKVAYSSLY